MPLAIFGSGEHIAKAGEPCTGGRYAELVGSLLWLSNSTRPVITQATNLLARYMSCPTVCHYNLGMCVLRYQAGTVSYGLTLGGTTGKVALAGFCDSDFAGDIDTRRSTTGFVFTLNGSAVSWQSKLQQTVARSTTEAEYMAAAAAVREALWLRKLQAEFEGGTMRPVMMHSDSQGALAVLKNASGTARTKHIDVLHHFARDRIMRGEVTVAYLPSTEMIADCLTKALPLAKHHWCREHMGVSSL